MLIILDAKYKKDDLNKVMTKQFQHKKYFLNFYVSLKIF